MKRVYLAGPHDDSPYRISASAGLAEEGLSPVDPMVRPYYGDPEATIRADLAEILTCDFVLALFGAGATPGTAMECFFARQHGIPVVSIVTASVSPWIAWASAHVTDGVEAGVALLAEIAREPLGPPSAPQRLC